MTTRKVRAEVLEGLFDGTAEMKLLGGLLVSRARARLCGAVR
ncbi:hypothetical protein [Mycobacterium heidelbergense]|nr:hypothetical protein [Mycobacterium heidelbergense]